MDSEEVGERPMCESSEEIASINIEAEAPNPDVPIEIDENVSNDRNDVIDTDCSAIDESNVDPNVTDALPAVENADQNKSEDELKNDKEEHNKKGLDDVGIDNEKFHTLEATDTESVQDKCNQEPMDIDEILESLDEDPETVASGEECCDVATKEEQSKLDESIVDSVKNESEQNILVATVDEADVQLLPHDVANAEETPAADIDKILSPARDDVELNENPNETLENVEKDLIPAEDVLEVGKEALTPEISIETVKEDIQLDQNATEALSIADFNKEGDADVVEIDKTPDQNVQQTQENDEGKLEDAAASESVNVFDLILENENLFGRTDLSVDEPTRSVKPCEENKSDVPMDHAETGVNLDDNKSEENSTLPENSLENPKEDLKIVDMVEKTIEDEVQDVEMNPKADEMIEEAIEQEENDQSIELKTEKQLKTEGKSLLRRECLNSDCSMNNDTFYEAPEFVINHYHLKKRSKTMYACEECYNLATESYGELCAALEDKQPLFLKNIMYSDLVEIIDSSDEEEENDSVGEKHDTFDADTLALFENEMETVIKETLERVNIGQQMDWNRQILTYKIEDNEKNGVEMMNELRILQNRIDKLYTNTYNFKHSFLEDVQSLDLVTLKPTQICNETYPPVGELKHSDIEYNTMYYTFRSKLISRWLPCKVVDKIENNGQMEYKIRFCREKKEVTNIRTVPRKYLAYGRASEYRLNIGTRVIAMFDNADNTQKNKSALQLNNFYPGIIAEPLTVYTNWRYLVFFDDGWVQYVQHENIRVICDSIENVWELIEEPGAKTFIEGYLKKFKQKRPIVQVRRGQRIQTEVNGKWYNAIVNEVDASLVQVYFEETKRHEWIYRGSTRLFPLYKKLNHVKAFANRNEATIEYIVIDDEKEPERTTEPPVEEVIADPKTPPSKVAPILRTFASQAARDTPQQKHRDQKRAVAKKSTAPLPKPAVQHMNNSTIYVDEDKPKGKVVYYTAKRQQEIKKYLNHECQPSCLIQINHNLSSYSPLSKPLLTGFERQIEKARFNKKYVIYRAPCGRRLRDISEMHKYLRMTNCKLNVDNFTFDPLIHCLAEYVIETQSCVLKKPDLSGGIEKMPIQLVNCYDSSMPPPCTYSAKRIPTEGVNLNCDPEFLCGCDCTDDCLDKSKCACWKLTLQGSKYGNPETPIEDIGYQYKRLYEPVPTGIYECNSRCKCKASCLNRVVQHPIQLKLQVFKTVNRGWGIRCLNDVARGSFICCYAGNLLTESNANEAGGDLGDEYFAELDYIEVMENMKEGYEPDVVPEENDSSGTDEDFDVELESRRTRNDDSDDEFVARSYTASSEDSENRRYRTRNSVDTRRKHEAAAPKETAKRKDRNSSSDDDGDEVRQVKNFMASNTMPLNDDPDDERSKSIRKLFGSEESVYIMDAKKAGNIGRYFNHSCGPNLFVQNVFVDTHDLRFPWVAFFASTHIRAGTELTWNYNYEVGSVPGKVLICQCGDEKCRGRIL